MLNLLKRLFTKCEYCNQRGAKIIDPDDKHYFCNKTCKINWIYWQERKDDGVSSELIYFEDF